MLKPVIPPNIYILAGDFGCGQVSVNPSYSLEINYSLVNTINDNNLEQLVVK